MRGRRVPPKRCGIVWWKKREEKNQARSNSSLRTRDCVLNARELSSSTLAPNARSALRAANARQGATDGCLDWLLQTDGPNLRHTKGCASFRASCLHAPHLPIQSLIGCASQLDRGSFSDGGCSLIDGAAGCSPFAAVCTPARDHGCFAPATVPSLPVSQSCRPVCGRSVSQSLMHVNTALHLRAANAQSRLLEACMEK